MVSTLHRVSGVLADSHGWGHMEGWGGGWMWLWGSLMMLTWVVIVGGAIWVLGRAREGDRPSRARDILDERLARGEVTPDEHQERTSRLA